MKNFILITAALFCLGLASCTKNNSTATTSHVTVNLTDGPGQYDAVILSVKSVIITTEKGDQTLAVNGSPIDILRFRLGKDTLLAAQDIPAGSIEQVRLVLNSTGNRVVVNGVSYDLNTPSGQTSGVKLNVHDTLTAGIDYTLNLDFDAAQSIVTTGNGKYILKPVIRAIATAASGAITGVVSPIASYPKVLAINGTDTIGKFFFPGVPAATYTVKFIPVSPYTTTTVTGVMVTNGGVKDMGTVLIP